jgi:hypothetical protein
MEIIQEEKYQYDEVSFVKEIATKAKRLFNKKTNAEERKKIVSDIKTVKTFIPKEQDLSTKNETEDDGQNSLFNIKKNIRYHEMIFFKETFHS